MGSQETNRNNVSEIADERTRFEMYYQPFIGAVEAGLGSIMCSYNRYPASMPVSHVGFFFCVQ